jgi:putative sigma-54 modulation protein
VTNRRPAEFFLGASSVQVNISARHGQISEATKTKILAKVEKLNRLHGRLTQIDVTLDLAHSENPLVELQVSAEHKHDFVATEQAGELWASLDGALHKLEQQLRKYKEKTVDRHRSGAAKSEAERGA